MDRDNNVRAAITVLALGLSLLSPPAARAQGALFPPGPTFVYPVAHPRPTAIYGRLLSLDRGESSYGAEREAEAGIGSTLPVLALGRGRVPVTLGLGIAVAARFSLDDPRSALVSSDWVVGIHTTAGSDPWRLDLHLYHESSHLGDEYAERFDARRVDWTREVATLWVSRRLGDFRAHGSVSWTLIDELPLERGAAAAGIDYRGRAGRVLGAQATPIAGLFVEGVAYADWQVTKTARAGIELGASGRSVAISLVGLDGLSTQRQFYRERSRYVGVELRFEL